LICLSLALASFKDSFFFILAIYFTTLALFCYLIAFRDTLAALITFLPSILAFLTINLAALLAFLMVYLAVILAYLSYNLISFLTSFLCSLNFLAVAFIAFVFFLSALRSNLCFLAFNFFLSSLNLLFASSLIRCAVLFSSLAWRMAAY
jgi:hypothetical protein